MVGVAVTGTSTAVDTAAMDIHEAPEDRARLFNLDIKALPYTLYLRTPHWQETRSRALDRANHACEMCHKTDDLEVHHWTYARVAFERREDLAVLCRSCHSLVHKALRERDEQLRARDPQGNDADTPF